MTPGVYDGPGFTSTLNNAPHICTPHIDAAYPGSNKLTITLNITGSTLNIYTDNELPRVGKFIVRTGYPWTGG